MVYTAIDTLIRTSKNGHPLGKFATEFCQNFDGIQIEPRVGIEPTTYRLQGGCSATELPRRFYSRSVYGRYSVSGVFEVLEFT